MNKKLLLVLISSILTFGLLVFFVVVSWEVFVGGKCGDGVCDEIEKRNNACPIDCEQKPSYDDVTVVNDDTGAPYGKSPFAMIPGLGACTSNPKKMILPSTQIPFIIDLKLLIVHLKEKPIDWGVIESQEGVYNFNNADEEIGLFSETGAVLMATLETHNGLYGTERCEFKFEGGCRGEILDEKYWPQWVDYVKAVSERYCDEIKYYELDHELSPEGIDKNNKVWRNFPKEYANLFYATYEAMKEGCSDAMLITSGAQSSNKVGLDFEPNGFFERMFEELEKQGYEKFKDLGIDYHMWRDYEEQYADHVKYIDIINEFMEKHGYDKNEFYITSTSMGGNIYEEGEQANYIIKSYIASIAKGQDILVWNYIVESFSPQTVFIPQGLINNPCEDGLDFRKLGYYTYKLMVEKLEGSDWDNIQTIQESDNVYIYKFTNNEKPIWVAWNDGTSKTISLDVGSIGSVKITEAVPKYETGQEVTDYSTAFKTETKTVSNGKIEIILGESPVFVEEK